MAFCKPAWLYGGERLFCMEKIIFGFWFMDRGGSPVCRGSRVCSWRVPVGILAMIVALRECVEFALSMALWMEGQSLVMPESLIGDVSFAHASTKVRMVLRVIASVVLFSHVKFCCMKIFVCWGEAPK